MNVKSVLILLLALVVLPGCTSAVEVLQPMAATPQPVATVAPCAHELAILAVDFDPPLNYTRIVSNGGVTLLVAVENRGLSEEKEVLVSARLWDPADQRELVGETVCVRSLAAGEVLVVRFTQVSQLPRRDNYQLIVQIGPTAGETDTADNVRTYDIVVHTDN
jgi:hypothetical protein